MASSNFDDIILETNQYVIVECESGIQHKKMASSNFDDIILETNQYVIVECESGIQRKFWHLYAEKRQWQHMAIRTDIFDANTIITCKWCKHAHYISEMKLSCCEYDPEVKYCDRCDEPDERNIIDVTDVEDYKGPDASFKLSKYAFNAVAMGPILPHFPKKQRRKWNRKRPVALTENMKISYQFTESYSNRYLIVRETDNSV
jgi:hypothetical protein